MSSAPETGARVCALADLPVGTARAFEVAGRRVAVFHRPEGLFAVSDLCTHAGAPISEGSVAGEVVTCPLHDARFSLRTGAVLSGPAHLDLESFHVAADGEDVRVRVP